MNWGDVPNETGSRVYSGVQWIASPEAHTPTNTDLPPCSDTWTYGEEALNEAGTSGRPTVQEQCNPY